MAITLIPTSDGSHTLSVVGTHLTYHSRFGAVSESEHVFIQSGLKEILRTKNEISVFEMGFGTGLNALLTFREVEKTGKYIYYETTDTCPLDHETIHRLNYPEMFQTALADQFYRLHFSPWEKDVVLNSGFHIYKHRKDIREISFRSKFDLIYFDAFDPVAQPELWTKEVFQKLFTVMNREGILVTYSSKGTVRRALNDAGFNVEKLPGPKGKREIVRAWA